jgi:hypothetical protein
MKTLLQIFTLFISLTTLGQEMKVGASQAPINPSIPSFIAGHTQNRMFTGVHDSLFVKVVVIANGKNALAIITYDCIGMLYPQLEAVRQKIGAKITGLEASNIIMSSTHSHAGPDVVGIWGPDVMHSGADGNYMTSVVDITAEQIEQAWTKRETVIAYYGTGTYGEEWVHNISEPNELDRSVTVIQFRDQRGRSVATLTNFACHPTFLDAVHTQVSADYPGGFYREMDAKLGGTNLFLQGSIGGWVQPEGEPQTFEQAYKRGSELAGVTIGLLHNPKKVKGSGILFHSAAVDLPVQNQGFIQLSKAGVIKRHIDSTVRTEIAWFQIGNAVFATHPGETVPAMSHATKKLMHTDGPKFVMGLSMDALGYIIKPYFFDAERKIPHAEYLCSMSLGPGTSARIMEVLEKLSKK